MLTSVQVLSWSYVHILKRSDFTWWIVVKKKKIVKIPILEDNDKFNTDIRNKGNNRKKKWKNVSRGRYNFLPLFERLGEF